MIRKPRPSVMTIVVAVLIGAFVLPTGVGYAAYKHDRSQRSVLPGDTLVGGIDVSGLNRAEAIARVRAAVDDQLDRTATLTVGDDEYSITARELGVRDNTEAAVDAALEGNTNGSWLGRTWDRVFGSGGGPTVDVALTEPAQKPLRALVRKAARQSTRPPVDASVQVVGGLLKFVKAKPGFALRKKQALAALRASLVDGRAHEARLRTVQPKKADSTYNTAILIQTNANKLFLYKNQRIVSTYPVATGMAAYPTPLGEFAVELKRYMPTWVNPSPNSGWGASMPATIAPGPNNPLGLRALNLTAPLIRIHGSPAANTIGYNASHGCIRMHNSDVIKLYDQVPTGTPVIITQVGPYRPLNVSSTPTSTDPARAEGG